MNWCSMIEFYVINIKDKTLEWFDDVSDVCNYLWGRYLPKYIFLVSTSDKDFVIEINPNLDDFEEELRKIQ